MDRLIHRLIHPQRQVPVLAQAQQVAAGQGTVEGRPIAARHAVRAGHVETVVLIVRWVEDEQVIPVQAKGLLECGPVERKVGGAPVLVAVEDDQDVRVKPVHERSDLVQAPRRHHVGEQDVREEDPLPEGRVGMAGGGGAGQAGTAAAAGDRRGHGLEAGPDPGRPGSGGKRGPASDRPYPAAHADSMWPRQPCITS